MKEFEDPFETEDIDYSEGIEELLNEKPKYQFSWAKTGLVFVGFVGILSFSIMAFSKIAKSIIVPIPEHQTSMSFAESEKDSHNYGFVDGVDTNPDNETDAQALEQAQEDALNLEAQVESHQPQAEKVKNNPTKTQMITKKITEFEDVKRIKYVEVQPKAKKEVQTAAADENSLFRVVIGRYDTRINADVLIKDLKRNKIGAYVWRNNEENQNIYRVQLGAFSNKKAAEQFTKSIEQKGYTPYILYR